MFGRSGAFPRVPFAPTLRSLRARRRAGVCESVEVCAHWTRLDSTGVECGVEAGAGRSRQSSHEDSISVALPSCCKWSSGGRCWRRARCLHCSSAAAPRVFPRRTLFAPATCVRGRVAGCFREPSRDCSRRFLRFCEYVSHFC